MAKTAPKFIGEQKEVLTATTPDLIFTYNKITGKSIKKFSSRAAAETQTASAIMAAKQRAGHKGVPKGQSARAEDGCLPPEGKPVKEPKVKAEKPAKAPKPEKAPKAKPVKPAPAPAPTPAALAAKRTKAKSATPRRLVYEFVRFTEPDVPRRPHAESMRRKVLDALRKASEGKGEGGTNKPVSLTKLTETVGYSCRPFIHKLQAVGWCEVVPAQATLKEVK